MPVPPPPPNQKILNNALVPIHTSKFGPDGIGELATPEDTEHLLSGADYDSNLDNLHKAQENKKRNTYALKVAGANSDLHHQGSSTISKKATNHNVSSAGNKTGMYIASK
jgi:hypothetical protein